MKCTVIVTAYNQTKTIQQAIDSILNQKCNYPFEIIIGDDCSTDGTQDKCIEYQNLYPDKIKINLNSENIGVAGNFAFCVKQAKGEYIAICAADDFWHNPDKLQLQIDYLEKNPSIGLIYTDYNKLNVKSGKVIENYIKTSKKVPHTGFGLTDAIFKGKVPILTVTVMFRKCLFDDYIPIDDYIRLRFTIEDWPTWLILSKHTNFGYLTTSTSTYCYGHESISNPLNYDEIIKRFEKEHIMYKYLCDKFQEDLTYSKSGFESYVNKILLNLAYKKSDYRNAKMYAKRLSDSGSDNIKIKMAKNRILFKLFATFKNLDCK